MSSAPGASSASAAAKGRRAAADEEKAAKKRYKDKKVDTTTVEEVIDPGELEGYFEQGEWKPAWGNVEFDDDACLRNVTMQGKFKDGFFVPAGTILPLGAALPEMTVLKYGGYFPAGTSFQGGVMIPLHARMVNILPEETKDPRHIAEESLCLVQ